MPTIASATRANLVLAPIGMLASLVTTVVLVRALPASVYVDYMSIQAIILTATLIAEGGVSTAFMRYLPQMNAAGAAHSLYAATMRRRLGSSVIAAAIVLLAGPVWAHVSELDPRVWTMHLFGIIGFTVILTLVQSVPYYGLLGLLRHGEAGVMLQGSTVMKAVPVAVAGAMGASVLTLALINLIVTALTAAALVARMQWLVSGQRGEVPDGVMRDSFRYGLTSTVDKMTSWAGSTAVLLIVLAPSFSREALAPLAVAGDVLMKVLVVASMPVNNVVVPYFTQTLTRGESLLNAVGLACRATSLIFLPAIAALISTAPFIFPLLFGARYTAAVPLLIIMAIPTAAESWVRFVILNGLLVVQQYRWLVVMSIIEALAVLVVALASPRLSLQLVIAGVGIVKLLYTAAVLVIAKRHGVLPKQLAPRHLLPSVLAAGAIAWGAALAAHPAPAIGTAVSIVVFTLILFVAARLAFCVDAEVHDLVRAAAGKFAFAMKWVTRC